MNEFSPGLFLAESILFVGILCAFGAVVWYAGAYTLVGALVAIVLVALARWSR